jgi:hypothetical protein
MGEKKPKGCKIIQYFLKGGSELRNVYMNYLNKTTFLKKRRKTT